MSICCIAHLWWCMCLFFDMMKFLTFVVLLVCRVKRVTLQRPRSGVHASSMYVVVQLWLLAVTGQCSLTTCPPLVPCPGRRERRSYLPWGMMVRHTQLHSYLTCMWITVGCDPLAFFLTFFFFFSNNNTVKHIFQYHSHFQL